MGGAWNVSELSETSLQFSCEVKTAQKKKKKFLTLKIRETWVNQQKSHSIKVSQRLKEKKKKAVGKVGWQESGGQESSFELLKSENPLRPPKVIMPRQLYTQTWIPWEVYGSSQKCEKYLPLDA